MGGTVAVGVLALFGRVGILGTFFRFKCIRNREKKKEAKTASLVAIRLWKKGTKI